MEKLITTPLTDWNRGHGAKMVPFAGFDMPVQYTSILAEHEQTRTKAAVFDICHMGEFYLSGEGAAAALSTAVTHDLDTLAAGKCRYGFLLNDTGGVIDDLIIYCLGPDHYMLVVNGSRIQTDFDTIKSRLPASLSFVDASTETAKIDLQGPLAFDVLKDRVPGDFSGLKYFNFIWTEFAGAKLMVSRTGYTGELGYELFLPSSEAEALWETLVADPRVAPAGLGARDTLRLEMGYPLYGQDLDEEHTPAEAGYGWLLTAPANYVGKGKAAALRQKLIALEIPGRRSARHGDEVIDKAGKTVGVVTSASFAPSLGHAIALAYVTAAAAEAKEFRVKAARAELPAVKRALPFYKNGTARKNVTG
ncbi:MAG: glycine cleavage system aminomethyltransferase GcvT [Solidesulfovibrio sp.]